MRSTAHVRNHAIHPALVPFPFAFLSGAAAFDWLGWLANRPAFWTAGGYLAPAGVATALIAAVPGLIDYFYTVPPQSTGKQRATRHALGNVTALVLIGLAWWLRGGAGQPPTAATLALDAAGAAALVYAGWLGGTLVGRNLIGVDHRYANAGRWQKQTVEAKKGEPVVVAAADELEEGQMKLLRVRIGGSSNGHRRIALARTTGGYVAFDDRCTHRGGSLAGGVLVDDVVHCLWHGSQFECATGKVHCGPAKREIKTYEVKQDKGKITLRL
jgi:nitrite reductase/ring-hydroxylating ferredoxin subunit/uncharacterized membrane protein